MESEIKDAARGGNKSAASVTVLEESSNFDKESINTEKPHTLPSMLCLKILNLVNKNHVMNQQKFLG